MITVTNCGYDSHHSKVCNIEHKSGYQDYLIILLKKEAWVVFEDQKIIVQPNSLICFPPGAYVHYGCDVVGYNDDWIHFVLDEKELPFFQTLLLPMCTVLRPRNFHLLSEYVHLITNNYLGFYSNKDQIIDSFMHIFFETLKEELKIHYNDSMTEKYYHDFSKLRTQIYNNPANSWSVPKLAASLCLSLSYFQHLYKQFFSCSCQQDIVNARHKQAKYFLSNSDMSIRNISNICGYENDVHFMRQFKKYVGVTPTEYRLSLLK